MSNNKNLLWEEIGFNEFRAKIPGGWLVKVCETVVHLDFGPNNYSGRFQNDGYDWRLAITFVPDVNHEWTIEK